MALVRPLYKSGDPSVPTNYRPVSLLPIVSKLLEKLVQRQLADLIQANNVLPVTQYAFRARHSTEQALVVLTDGLLAAKDQKLHTGACFLDMSKAFDKVRHHVLIQDLFEVGVTGRALSWIASYLSIRQQYVRFGTLLKWHEVVHMWCSTVQGLLLGPLLFSVYTRDVPSVVEPAKSIQFADDIEIQFSHTSTDVISANLSTAVTKLSDWLRQRGLILNETKSHLLALLSSSVCRTQTANTTDQSHLRQNTPPRSLLSQVSRSDRGQHFDIQGAH
eukprot:scpid95546/ scgid4445/ Probable RNA-directed DNA polymerase from transposon X-element; Reverse transcriptase